MISCVRDLRNFSIIIVTQCWSINPYLSSHFSLRISCFNMDKSDFTWSAHRFCKRRLMVLWLVLLVLSSFLKIGVISAYYKLVVYSELDNALLKLCNIKYAVRSRFSLIILIEMLKVWEAFYHSVKPPFW